MLSVTKYFILFIFSLSGKLNSNEFPVQTVPDHHLWSIELKKHVSAEGKVNYKEWSKDTRGIDQYLLQLSNNPAQNDWSKNERLAYWINAYNAFTIKLVLDHYPIKSIRDLNGGNPWDVVWIKLGNTTYSLNQIENEIIRKQFNDPRIHFALNCASNSCPPLMNEALDPNKLESQLSNCTSKFINNKKFNLVNSGTIQISQIFNWYKKDFSPDVISFLNQYLSVPLKKETKVEYLPYDWNLNDET